MNIIELKKENLIAFLSDKENCCGHGSYGILMNYDENTLIKIYYKDIFNTYTTLDDKVLDEEISILLEVEKQMKEIFSDYVGNLQRLKIIYTALKRTKSNSLIKGIVTYKGYPIGVLLENYKGYLNFADVYRNSDAQAKIKVLKMAKELMVDLINNNIFPTDIKENNILINPNNLDVKLIDLDGKETRIESKTYIKNYPHIKNNCINRFNEMSIRLSKY